jgi:hypothetical protein
MKKVLLLSVVAFGMLTSCACSGLKVRYSKTEPQAMHERDLKDFERIELQGSLDVKYTQNDSFSVRVEAPVKVLHDVETYVTGNKLVVRMKGEGKLINLGVSDADDVTVYVTSPDFLGISLMGSGDFLSAQPLDTDTLTIELRGSGDIRFQDVICDQVNVSLIGSGDVSLDRVQTQWGQLDLIGSGDIDVFFDNSGEVNAQVKGSGDIEIKGTVRKMNKLVRGTGDIDTDELMVR